MTDERHSADERLTPEECWKMLGDDGIGRLATVVVDPVTGSASPDIFPINYLVHEGKILFRSAPGSKLMDIAAQSAVAFEADGHRGRTHWSVVVRGQASRILFDEVIESSGILDLEATHPSEKWNYLQIEADVITGIRFRQA